MKYDERIRFKQTEDIVKKEMVVNKNINVNVHLIDNNMYMYMMKCNIEA